jgi:hypothetical protein
MRIDLVSARRSAANGPPLNLGCGLPPPTKTPGADAIVVRHRGRATAASPSRLAYSLERLDKAMAPASLDA